MEKQQQRQHAIAPLTAGEKPYLLVFRARKRDITTKDVAEGMNLHPEYLPHLYKQSRLTMETVHAASKFFNVHPSLFDDDPVDDTAKRLEKELKIMRTELNETSLALKAAQQRIKTLEEDKIIREAREIKARRKKGEDGGTNQN